jgi:hypothetical protein
MQKMCDLKRLLTTVYQHHLTSGRSSIKQSWAEKIEVSPPICPGQNAGIRGPNYI